MLTGVEIPEKVTKIGKGAFSQQWKVNLVDQSFKVTYPEGIEEIEAEAFSFDFAYRQNRPPNFQTKI